MVSRGLQCVVVMMLLTLVAYCTLQSERGFHDIILPSVPAVLYLCNVTLCDLCLVSEPLMAIYLGFSPYHQSVTVSV